MIINDKEYGKFDVSLADDGTLDTVISVILLADFPEDQEGTREFRFGQEYAADFRDSDGAMTDDGFEQLAQEAVESYIEQYLI